MNFLMEIHNIIGTIGVGLILTCYFLIQTGKINAENPYYSILNLCGALMILLSLYFEFNFASVVIESFWVLISLIGLARYFINKKRIHSEA